MSNKKQKAIEIPICTLYGDPERLFYVGDQYENGVDFDHICVVSSPQFGWSVFAADQNGNRVPTPDAKTVYLSRNNKSFDEAMHSANYEPLIRPRNATSPVWEHEDCPNCTYLCTVDWYHDLWVHVENDARGTTFIDRYGTYGSYYSGNLVDRHPTLYLARHLAFERGLITEDAFVTPNN